MIKANLFVLSILCCFQETLILVITTLLCHRQLQNYFQNNSPKKAQGVQQQEQVAEIQENPLSSDKSLNPFTRVQVKPTYAGYQQHNRPLLFLLLLMSAITNKQKSKSVFCFFLGLLNDKNSSNYPFLHFSQIYPITLRKYTVEDLPSTIRQIPITVSPCSDRGGSVCSVLRLLFLHGIFTIFRGKPFSVSSMACILEPSHESLQSSTAAPLSPAFSGHCCVNPRRDDRPVHFLNPAQMRSLIALNSLSERLLILSLS